VARAALEDGHRLLFLTGNPGEVAPLLASAGIEGGASPSVARTGRAAGPPAGAVATSFADILGGAGFGDAGFLRDMTAAWDEALARLRPAAVVCEMSPFLCLAAFGGDVPVLSLGYGFVLPPPHLPRFPALLDGPPLYAEAALLESAADVCRARGRRVPATLPALLAGTAHAVTGMDALDPYREHRPQAAVGPLDLEVARAAPEPDEDVFAYLLGDAPPTVDVLRALAASALRGRAYVRRGGDAHRAALAGSGIVWLDRPEPARDAFPRARLVVHHASMLTSEEALAAGRPQLVVPLYLEHLFTARALRALGVAAVVLPSSSTAGLVRALSAAASAPEERHAAGEVADRYWREVAPLPDLARRLLRAVAAA
jgi:hypothetical protein